jgi:hypothetical protein
MHNTILKDALFDLSAISLMTEDSLRVIDEKNDSLLNCT